jgi:hypothetical protein
MRGALRDRVILLTSARPVRKVKPTGDAKRLQFDAATFGGEQMKKWGRCGLQCSLIGRTRIPKDLPPRPGITETSTSRLPAPATTTIARRHGQERYADVPVSPRDVDQNAVQMKELHPAASGPLVEASTSTPRTALTEGVYSEISYHHGAPHIDGHDWILPHNATASCSSTAEHAEVRSYRYATPSTPLERTLRILLGCIRAAFIYYGCVMIAYAQC